MVCNAMWIEVPANFRCDDRWCARPCEMTHTFCIHNRCVWRRHMKVCCYCINICHAIFAQHFLYFFVRSHRLNFLFFQFFLFRWYFFLFLNSSLNCLGILCMSCRGKFAWADDLSARESGISWWISFWWPILVILFVSVFLFLCLHCAH